MIILDITIPGVPQPKGSKTAVARCRKGPGGKLIPICDRKTGRPIVDMLEGKSSESRKRYAEWHAEIERYVRGAIGWGCIYKGAVHASFAFRMPRPKSHYGTGANKRKLKTHAPSWPVGKPDLDKLVRSVGDVLSGLVYIDDSQRVTGTTSRGESEKRYCRPGEEPGVRIVVETVTDDVQGSLIEEVA